MLTGIYQTIITLLVTLIFYTQDAFFVSCYEEKRKARQGTRSYRYTCAAGFFLIVMALQPIYFSWLSLEIPGQVGLVVQIIGIVLIVAALVFHVWARKHLRQFYAERIEIQRLHWVVDTGPYALVRHPISISFIVIALGFLLVNPGVVTLLTLVFFLWYFIAMALKEEELLALKVPGYQKYIRRTHGFFPRLNRVKGNQGLESRQ